MFTRATVLYLGVTLAGCPTSTTTKESDSATPGTTPTAETGTAGACLSCADYALGSYTTVDPNEAYYNLCEPSAILYGDLAACVCGGACAKVCADNACANLDPSTECQACTTAVEGGCGTELGACLADL